MNEWEAKSLILQLTKEVFDSGGGEDDLAARILVALHDEGFSRDDIIRIMKDVNNDLKERLSETKK